MTPPRRVNGAGSRLSSASDLRACRSATRSWPAVAPAHEDLARVGAEGHLAQHPFELFQSAPRAPANLALLMTHEAIPLPLVHSTPRLRTGPSVPVPEQEPEVDAHD